VALVTIDYKTGMFATKEFETVEEAVEFAKEEVKKYGVHYVAVWTENDIVCGFRAPGDYTPYG
jgi:hypothetical protein